MSSGRVYRRTAAGIAAWQREDPRVPIEYRRLLGLIDGEANADSLRLRFARYSPDATIELLDELVEQGLLEAVEPDLDFTNSFNLGELRKAAGRS